MQNLSLSLVQTPLYWQQTEANLASLEEKFWAQEEKTDIIVLPETFNKGFSVENQKHVEPLNFTTFKWMKNMASQTGSIIIGSYLVHDKGLAYNRLFWVQPNGEYNFYNKRHLFKMGGEGKNLTQGNDLPIFKLKGWRICPQICYDLRFPAWSRNKTTEGQTTYDALIYIANWPKPRISAWTTLLKARAIENLAYTVGVNRIGEDGNGLEYNGQSAAYDFKGEPLCQLNSEETIKVVYLDYDKLANYRKDFPFYLDADSFDI